MTNLSQIKTSVLGVIGITISTQSKRRIMNIKELSQTQAPQKCRCENCGKTTICYLQGSITPITRQLAYEEWLCADCID